MTIVTAMLVPTDSLTATMAMGGAIWPAIYEPQTRSPQTNCLIKGGDRRRRCNMPVHKPQAVSPDSCR